MSISSANGAKPSRTTARRYVPNGNRFASRRPSAPVRRAWRTAVASLVNSTEHSSGRPDGSLTVRRSSPVLLPANCPRARRRSAMFNTAPAQSESRRCVHPEEHRFVGGRVVPPMADRALEPEAIAFVQRVALQLVEPDLERPRDHEDELLALVRIGSVAAGARLHAKQLALELPRAYRQQLDAHARLRLNRAAIRRPHEMTRLLRHVEEFEHRRPVRSREAVQRCHRRVRARQLDRAQETRRDRGFLRRFDDAQAGALAQPAKLGAEIGGAAAVARFRRHGLAEHLADAGPVQLLDVAKIFDPLEDLEELRAVQTVASVAAGGADESHALPQTQRRGAHAEHARRLAHREQADAGDAAARVRLRSIHVCAAWYPIR